MHTHHRTTPTLQILMGGTAVWQRRDVVVGGNLSTEFKLPKGGALGGKSDTLCSMSAQYNNKGNGQVRGGGRLMEGCRGLGVLPEVQGLRALASHICQHKQEGRRQHTDGLRPAAIFPCSWCCASTATTTLSWRAAWWSLCWPPSGTGCLERTSSRGSTQSLSSRWLQQRAIAPLLQEPSSLWCLPPTLSDLLPCTCAPAPRFHSPSNTVLWQLRCVEVPCCCAAPVTALTGRKR